MEKYPNTNIDRNNVNAIINSLKNKTTEQLHVELKESSKFIDKFKSNQQRLENFLLTGEGKMNVLNYCVICGLFKYKDDENMIDKIIDDYNFILDLD